jgi:DNA mismatch repair protein MutH
LDLAEVVGTVRRMPALRNAPPESEAELLARAQDLAGQSLQSLAEQVGKNPPSDLRRAKGWAGTLLEVLLGASAASRPEPDFLSLGVEMKTLPVSSKGRPRESTYICTVPLLRHSGLVWEHCCVRRKLRRVLWIPVEGDPQIPPAERRVGWPLLWTPAPEEEALLRSDWEELMELVVLGQGGMVTAHHGTVLQIRPKAANSRARCWGIGEQGERIRTLPRGFYLRTVFTEAILRRHFLRHIP